MEITQTFASLKNFIDENGLCSVTFGRHNPMFASRLHYSFPHLTKYFNCDYGINEPLYPDMIKLEIDQSIFDHKLESKNLTFYIQTVIGNKFLFIKTSANSEKDCESIYDIVMSNNLDDINNFDKYLTNAMKPINQKSLIYTWSSYNGSWNQDRRKMYNKNITDLIGLDDIFNNIKKDIKTYRKHKDHLIRLGESNGLNYMFYGPPGTGKSSLVRAIAMNFCLPVYVCKMTSAANENQITNMLIPGSNETDDVWDNNVENEDGSLNINSIKNFKIVLIEDFDRYIEAGNNSSTMSAILNALDGIFPSYGIIRFFSANNPESLSKNLALTTRLNKAFYFANPNNNQMEMQVLNAYANKYIDQKKLVQFIDYIKDKHLSMRQLTHFLCQHLDSENPMDDVIENMEKWINDMIAFSICKDSDSSSKLLCVNNNVDDDIPDLVPGNMYDNDKIKSISGLDVLYERKLNVSLESNEESDYQTSNEENDENDENIYMMVNNESNDDDDDDNDDDEPNDDDDEPNEDDDEPNEDDDDNDDDEPNEDADDDNDDDDDDEEEESNDEDRIFNEDNGEVVTIEYTQKVCDVQENNKRWYSFLL